MSNLDDDEKHRIVEMHNLFCGLHVIINMASTTKVALKDYEGIAAKQMKAHGFQKSSSRTVNLMYELSKAFNKAFDYQKWGAANDWNLFLHILRVF